MAVTFHHGPAQLEPLERYCCELVCERYLAGEKLLIRTRDAEQLRRLDHALWAWPDSLLPHGELEDPLEPPIALTCVDDLEPGGDFATLVIAPGANLPLYAGRFRQVHFLVLTDGGDAHQAARESFRQLKHSGVQPVNHQIPANST